MVIVYIHIYRIIALNTTMYEKKNLHYYLYYGVNSLIPNLVENLVQNSIFNMSR